MYGAPGGTPKSLNKDSVEEGAVGKQYPLRCTTTFLRGAVTIILIGNVQQYCTTFKLQATAAT